MDSNEHPMDELTRLRSESVELEDKLSDWKTLFCGALFSLVVVAVISMICVHKERSKFRTCVVCGRPEPRPKTLWVCPVCREKIGDEHEEQGTEAR